MHYSGYIGIKPLCSTNHQEVKATTLPLNSTQVQAAGYPLKAPRTMPKPSSLNHVSKNQHSVWVLLYSIESYQKCKSKSTLNPKLLTAKP